MQRPAEGEAGLEDHEMSTLKVLVEGPGAMKELDRMVCAQSEAEGAASCQ